MEALRLRVDAAVNGTAPPGELSTQHLRAILDIAEGISTIVDPETLLAMLKVYEEVSRNVIANAELKPRDFAAFEALTEEIKRRA